MWCGSLWHTLPLPLPLPLPPVNLGSVSLMLHKKQPPPPPKKKPRERLRRKTKEGGKNPHISCFWTIKSLQYSTFKQKTFTHTEVWSYNIPIGYFVRFVCVCVFVYVYIYVYIPYPYCMYYCWQCWWTVCISDITLCHWFPKYQGWRLFQARWCTATITAHQSTFRTKQFCVSALPPRVRISASICQQQLTWWVRHSEFQSCMWINTTFICHKFWIIISDR